MKLPLDNLNYPVRIIIGNSSGSGFFIKHNNSIYLVTAKHVLYQQDSITKSFNLFDKKMKVVCHPLLAAELNKTPRIYEFDLEVLSLGSNLKAHPLADIVVIKVASISNNNGRRFILEPVSGITVTKVSDGDLVHYDMKNARKFDQAEVTNDVFVLGYPSSLSNAQMNQIDYDNPLVRKGIVAGKNTLNKSLILDCPVYGGNSGGLVLEVNLTGPLINIHLIGMVVQFVPFVEQWRNVQFPDLLNTSLQNSGYSVALPVDYIFDLIEEIGAN